MPSFKITELSVYVEKKGKKISFTKFLKLETGHFVKIRESLSEKDLTTNLCFPEAIVTEKLDISKPTEESLSLKCGDYSLQF